MRGLIFLLVTILLCGCSETSRTKIVERWDNGAKKRVITYKGEGEKEDLVEEQIFTSSGLLFKSIKPPTRDTIYFPNKGINDSLLVGNWELKKEFVEYEKNSGVGTRSINRMTTLKILPNSKYEMITVDTSSYITDTTIIRGEIYSDGKMFLIPQNRILLLHESKVKIDNYIYGGSTKTVTEREYSLNKKGEIVIESKVFENGDLVYRNKENYPISNFPQFGYRKDSLAVRYYSDNYNTLNLYVKQN